MAYECEHDWVFPGEPWPSGMLCVKCGDYRDSNEPSVLFVILHSQIYADRKKALLKTWLKGQNYIFYGDYHNDDPKVIKVSDDKTYHSNEEKFINIFNRLSESDHDWIMFIDDDTFVNVAKLKKEISSFDRGVIHGQRINTWHMDRSLYYLSGGAGILIHRDLYKKYKGKLNNYRTGYSDVSFGLFMRELRIPFVGSDLFYSQPPSFYLKDGQSEKELVNNSISFHYIKTLEQHQILMRHIYD